MRMTLNLANKIISKAVDHAKRTGNTCSIVIVDENAWLVAIYRMDGTPGPTADLARDKAWTAASFRMPSADITRFGDPSSPGFGFNTQNWNDRLTTIAGGLPIKHGEDIIGAIGVAGGTPEQDVAVCEAVMSAVVEGK
ncbi:MAG: GlcG/HbpS family heme-binding protein [Dehalococcoidia bacterium]